MINFSIHGEPVAWARPRLVWARGAGKPRGYTQPAQSQHAEKLRGYAAAAVRAEKLRGNRDWPLRGALLLGARFYRSKPQRESRPYPTQKPDEDNYRKIPLDALEGIVYWNDSQVIGPLGWPLSGKFFAEPGKARTEITVITLEELNLAETKGNLRELLREILRVQGAGSLLDQSGELDGEVEPALPFILSAGIRR